MLVTQLAKTINHQGLENIDWLGGDEKPLPKMILQTENDLNAEVNNEENKDSAHIFVL